MADAAIMRRKSQMFLTNISPVYDTHDEVIRKKLKRGKFPPTKTGVIKMISLSLHLGSIASWAVLDRKCGNLGVSYSNIGTICLGFGCQLLLFMWFSFGKTVKDPGFWINIDIGLNLLVSLLTIVTSIISMKLCKAADIQHLSAMRRWIHLLIFGAAIGIAKSASFMKAVILAGLGLAGLWMVHTLAQDFNAIMQHGFGSGGDGDHGGGAKLFNDQEIKVFKRSANEIKDHGINWEIVIKRDPASCARSFICQLAASKESELIYEEMMILNLTRAAAGRNSWASKQLKEAVENGESTSYPNQCMKMYKFCPYTKRMMMALLRVFGSR